MENKMNNVKIVKFAGGLGNQIFQYAMGLYLEKIFHCKTKFFNECNHLGKNNKIEKIISDIDYANTEELKAKKYYFKSYYRYRIYRRIARTMPFLRTDLQVENGSKYNNNISENKIIFDGYWQSYRYIEPISDELNYKISLRKYASSYSKTIENTTISVFVHIRRGDYLNQQNIDIFEFCTLDYYKKAIYKIKSKLNNPTFFIISNDIQWAKESLLLKDVNMIYVENKGENADLQDLYCMTCCQHGIIANSTFSWWGAWLIKNKSKMIIAPQKWYKDIKMNQKTKDLIPSNWIRL